MNRGVVLLAILVATAAGQERQQWRVGLHGAGPIQVGMTLREVRAAVRDRKAKILDLDGKPTETDCAYLRTSKVPVTLGVMFLRGVVARVDVYERGISTLEGAAVGDTEERIRHLYPGILVEPHFYNPEGGHYLRRRGQGVDADLEILFETDDGRVSSFRAGTLEGVALVEGCA